MIMAEQEMIPRRDNGKSRILMIMIGIAVKVTIKSNFLRNNSRIPYYAVLGFFSSIRGMCGV